MEEQLQPDPPPPPPDQAAPAAHDLSPKAVKRRLGLNLIANVYNQGVTVAVQLAGIPLFLTAWGPEQYGVWIAISALPFYFYAISDLGFVSLAANDMAMMRARNELDEAIVVFQSTLAVVLLATLLFAAVALAAAFVLPLMRWLKVPTPYAGQAMTSLIVLLAQLPFVLLLGLLTAGFRADGKYAQGALYLGTARLLDGLMPAVAAQLGAGLVVAATVMLLVKFVSVVVIFALLRYEVRWLTVGVGRANYRTITSMLGPAAAFLALPLAHMIQITGTTLIVSATLGPVAVATFNTIRTLGNVAFNAFGIIVHSIWFEMSSLLGTGKADLARAVNRRVANVSFWLALASCAFLALAGERILRVWTRGEVGMDAGLFYLQLVSIVIASVWRVSGVVLLATNNHRRYAIPQLVVSILQLLVTWATLRSLGLAGAGAAMVLAEIAMLAAVLRPSLRLLGERGWDFARGVVSPPSPMMLWNAVARRRPVATAPDGAAGG